MLSVITVSFSASLIKFYRPALIYLNDIRPAVYHLPDSMRMQHKFCYFACLGAEVQKNRPRDNEYVVFLSSAGMCLCEVLFVFFSVSVKHPTSCTSLLCPQGVTV